MSETNLAKRIAKLMPIASKDETRFHLNGVHLRASKDVNKIYLEVTDGHKAVKETVLHEEMYNILTQYKDGIIIHSDQLISLRQIAKDKRVLSINLAKVLGRDCLVFGTRPVEFTTDFKYPNMDSLLPQIKGDELVIGFNAGYMLQIAQVSDSRTPIVKLLLKVKRDADGNIEGIDSVAPINVQVSGDLQDSIKAVCMPCRV